MTSAELKHRVKLQEWAARIQDCRSSGLSVRAWCRQEEINAATYYRWEQELLALAETEPCSSVPAVRFAEFPAPKRGSRNAAECFATLHIGNVSLDSGICWKGYAGLQTSCSVGGVVARHPALGRLQRHRHQDRARYGRGKCQISLESGTQSYPCSAKDPQFLVDLLTILNLFHAALFRAF